MLFFWIGVSWNCLNSYANEDSLILNSVNVNFIDCVCLCVCLCVFVVHGFDFSLWLMRPLWFQEFHLDEWWGQVSYRKYLGHQGCRLIISALCLAVGSSKGFTQEMIFEPFRWSSPTVEGAITNRGNSLCRGT